MDIPFAPGAESRLPSPLSRFVPPLEQGSVTRALERFGRPGELILDPFGASPRLAIEAAAAGRAVLVAVNNPVVRYLLRHTGDPFSLEQLQAVLSRLANATKDDGRLEPFLLDLYRTQCSRCGEWVSAEHFVWDKELGEPVLRFYNCPSCNRTIEEPVTEEDRQRAGEYSSRGLHHAMALEQLAPRDSPDRQHAEDALAVYPERAIYAVITLLNKIDQLEDGQEAAAALMLSAMDQANALWGYPEGRSRPLQLVASARYLESNVWRALERAVGYWSLEDPAVEVRDWSGELEPVPGSVTIFAGPVRELAKQLPERAITKVVTVIPRPNQAFWTLSALWAGWLWGRRSADPIRAVLRRRRYDWAWHADALKATLRSMAGCLAPSAQVLGLVPDVEPGFLAAVLAGFDGSGFALTGRALRLAEQQALLSWERGGGAVGPRQAEWLEEPMRQAAVQTLRMRGEPARYPLPHAAAWTVLAGDRWLANVKATENRSALSVVGEQLDHMLGDEQVFVHLGRGQEPESGHYWLADDRPGVAAGRAEPQRELAGAGETAPSGLARPADGFAGAREVALPLADRVEGLVLDALRSDESLVADELDAELCLRLPGLLTPDRRFLKACLQSYAVHSPDDDRWRLRPEDRPQARAADRSEIAELLAGLGRRLGFTVREQGLVYWEDQQQGTQLVFSIHETARFGPVTSNQRADPSQALVIPGGRGALIAEKARRNPLLQAWLDTPPTILKFRHVRRLVEDTTLDRRNLSERLILDPPGPEDPQLPLL